MHFMGIDDYTSPMIDQLSRTQNIFLLQLVTVANIKTIILKLLDGNSNFCNTLTPRSFIVGRELYVKLDMFLVILHMTTCSGVHRIIFKLTFLFRGEDKSPRGIF